MNYKNTSRLQTDSICYIVAGDEMQKLMAEKYPDRKAIPFREDLSKGNYQGFSIDSEFISGRASFWNVSEDEYIQKLPDGYNTPLMRIFEQNGLELSGGQWQKLAFARALYKKSAELLILDEPTAALDPKTEFDIYDEFLHHDCKNIILDWIETELVMQKE